MEVYRIYSPKYENDYGTKSYPSRAYFRVILVTLCRLGSFGCRLGHLKVWSALSLLCACYFAEFFLCLDLYMFYISLENSTTVVLQHVDQYGIIQQRASHEILDCLKGVVHKKAQALSQHSAVLQNFLEWALS